ncbi:MAG: long-chain fatty acid--CoA ligase, partial [Chitinophagaceae bacterium]
MDQKIKPVFNEATTIPSLLRNVVKNIHLESQTFLIHKQGPEWVETSFKQTLDRADAVSAFFLSKGIEKDDRMGLMIENGPDYVYYDQGIQQIGGVNVSIYPTLSEHEVEYIINDSEIKSILIGNNFLYRKILKVATNCPGLKFIIPVFEGFEKVAVPENIPAEIIPFTTILQSEGTLTNDVIGEITRRRDQIQQTDLSSLIYTSGTTGTPKGVMLTHSNFVNNVRVALDQIPVIDQNETFLSFLPLSHVFERTAT